MSEIDAPRAARALYPDPWGDADPINDGGLSHAQREAYVRGRADERAQIAARRDEVAEAVKSAIDDAYTFEGDLDPQVDGLVTTAVLAALEVERG